MLVRSDDPSYARQARIEADFWDRSPFTVEALSANMTAQAQRFVNATETGDPDTWWLDDLIARGPFARAAVLGSTGGAYERRWLEARASRRLDIFELSRGVIAKARARLCRRRFGLRWPAWRARFIEVDLNFVRLPRSRYDVVWASNCIHHLVNLEHVFDEVASSLRPGGLFAFHDYIGEPHLDYGEGRLRLANAVWREIPASCRIGRVEAITPPPREFRSPFEAARSSEILDAARARFDTVHIGAGDSLFPLLLQVDFHALEREAPELVERVFRAEEDARRGGARPCYAYAVFAKRGSGPRA